MRKQARTVPCGQVERRTQQGLEGCLDDASRTPGRQGYGASMEWFGTWPQGGGKAWSQVGSSTDLADKKVLDLGV